MEHREVFSVRKMRVVPQGDGRMGASQAIWK